MQWRNLYSVRWVCFWVNKPRMFYSQRHMVVVNKAKCCLVIQSYLVTYIEGILRKGPYLPCVSMAGRALLAGYHRYEMVGILQTKITTCIPLKLMTGWWHDCVMHNWWWCVFNFYRSEPPHVYLFNLRVRLGLFHRDDLAYVWWTKILTKIQSQTLLIICGDITSQSQLRV